MASLWCLVAILPPHQKSLLENETNKGESIAQRWMETNGCFGSDQIFPELDLPLDLEVPGASTLPPHLPAFCHL